jgi:hypothetical protein
MTKQHAYTQSRDLGLVNGTSVYANGDMVGSAEIQLANVTNEGAGIVLQVITGYDLDSQNSLLTLLFFSAEPTNTTFTDNAALDIHDSDIPYFVGHVSVPASAYTSLSDNSVFTVRNIGLTMQLLNQDLWVVVMSGGTPTYTTTSSLAITLTYWQD